jgi:hypothetical protein
MASNLHLCLAIELSDSLRYSPIVSRVDPGNPSKVVSHVGEGQGITCVNDNGLDKEARESSSHVERGRDGGKASEQGVRRHRDEPEEQPEDEELPRLALEVDEEVENDTEYEGRACDDGLGVKCQYRHSDMMRTCTHSVNQHLRQSKRAHAVKREPLMPNQNRSQLILVGELGETLQRHEQNRQECGTTKGKRRVCRVLLIVERASRDQRLENRSAILCRQSGSIPEDELRLSSSQKGDLSPQ